VSPRARADWSQIENEDEFERWEALVTRATELEGGVTRNSSPSSIELVRNAYNCFLAKFPLFFGYWKKYADLEFAIGGTETAEMVSPCTLCARRACADPVAGVRARRIVHPQLRRSLGTLLCVQDGHEPRQRHHPRVSLASFLEPGTQPHLQPTTEQLLASFMSTHRLKSQLSRPLIAPFTAHCPSHLSTTNTRIIASEDCFGHVTRRRVSLLQAHPCSLLPSLRFCELD
jgi:hypothetical protein